MAAPTSTPRPLALTCPLPAYPPRPARPLSALGWFSAGGDNALSLWHQGAYVETLMQRRLPGRELFVINSPSAARQVLVEHAERYTKSRDTRRALCPLLGESLLVSEGELWRRQRRLIAPVLISRVRLARYAEVMVATIAEVLDRWGEAADGEIEMTLEATRLAAEVVSRALFSFPLGPHADRIFHAFVQYQDSLGRLDVLGLLGLPDWFPRPGQGVAQGAVRALEKVVDAILEVHRRGEAPRGDFVNLLTGARELGGAEAAPRRVRDEFMLALLAGHETTANALCWSFYLLSLCPSARRRLEEEVDRVLAGRTPGLEDLAALPYTRAVVEEALRLYPPIYQFTREAVVPDEIAGRRVPPGSLLLISPWLLQRHHRFWKDPDAFQPERFLTPLTPRHKRCHLPFGAGPRGCPGAGFARTELALALAMTSQRYRLDLRPGHAVEPLGRLTLRPRQGLPLRVERR